MTLEQKYRPMNFTDLVGQSSVAFQLSRMLDKGTLGHSLLFSGPHGCGKTSAARLTAMALNCLSADRPTSTPCGECSSCKAVKEGRSLAVREIDAASNNGVDFARELSQDANLSAMGRYKVFILDESHQ